MLTEQSNSNYNRATALLSDRFDITCYCQHCGCEETLDLHEVTFKTFIEYREHLRCPDCGSHNHSFNIKLKRPHNHWQRYPRRHSRYENFEHID